MTPVARLRAATAASHDMVDAAFGHHDLTKAEDYSRFLIAHALALPAAERQFATMDGLPPWRSRTPLLLADLNDLGHIIPTPLAFSLPDMASAAWGALYVTEGSRLGGIMLARSVDAGLPTRYLGARHESGEWRRLLAAIDAEGERQGQAWTDGAITGAEACFALYRHAAARIAAR